MNRIVLERYPVASLPDDMRSTLDDANEVRVTIEVLPAEGGMPSPVADRPPVAKPGLFSAYRHLAKARFSSQDEIDEHVRTLRDEWDRRDR